MEVVVTARAISCAKIQSNHHHQQTNTRFFYRPDALPVAQPTYLHIWGCKICDAPSEVLPSVKALISLPINQI